MQKTKTIKLFCLLLIVAVLCTMTGCFGYNGSYDYHNDQYDDSYDDYEENSINDYAALFEDNYDAEEYFQNNSTIISTVNAADSTNIHSGTDAYNNMADRGFGDCGVTADFDMNGEILENVLISDTSSDIYPSYTTIYQTSTGEIWSINEINGVVMAMPVTYNIEREVPVIITETGTVISYDLYGNKFYETIPNESEMIVKTVEKIDSVTLENLTAEEIDAL